MVKKISHGYYEVLKNNKTIILDSNNLYKTDDISKITVDDVLEKI